MLLLPYGLKSWLLTCLLFQLVKLNTVSSIFMLKLNFFNYSCNRERERETKKCRSVNLIQILESDLFSSPPTGTIHQNVPQTQNSGVTRAVNNSSVQEKLESLTSLASACCEASQSSLRKISVLCAVFFTSQDFVLLKSTFCSLLVQFHMGGCLVQLRV